MFNAALATLIPIPIPTQIPILIPIQFILTSHARPFSALMNADHPPQ